MTAAKVLKSTVSGLATKDQWCIEQILIQKEAHAHVLPRGHVPAEAVLRYDVDWRWPYRAFAVTDLVEPLLRPSRIAEMRK